jgi:hypothetical protein
MGGRTLTVESSLVDLGLLVAKQRAAKQADS